MYRLCPQCDPALTLFAIAVIGGNVEVGFFTQAHLHNAFVPALPEERCINDGQFYSRLSYLNDHAKSDLELEGPVLVSTRIKFGPICESPDVVHRELVTLLRVILTIARSDSLNVDAHCAKRIDEQLMPLADRIRTVAPKVLQKMVSEVLQQKDYCLSGSECPHRRPGHSLRLALRRVFASAGLPLLVMHVV